MAEDNRTDAEIAADELSAETIEHLLELPQTPENKAALERAKNQR